MKINKVISIISKNKKKFILLGSLLSVIIIVVVIQNIRNRKNPVVFNFGPEVLLTMNHLGNLGLELKDTKINEKNIVEEITYKDNDSFIKIYPNGKLKEVYINTLEDIPHNSKFNNRKEEEKIQSYIFYYEDGDMHKLFEKNSFKFHYNKDSNKTQNYIRKRYRFYDDSFEYIYFETINGIQKEEKYQKNYRNNKFIAGYSSQPTQEFVRMIKPDNIDINDNKELLQKYNSSEQNNWDQLQEKDKAKFIWDKLQDGDTVNVYHYQDKKKLKIKIIDDGLKLTTDFDKEKCCSYDDSCYPEDFKHTITKNEEDQIIERKFNNGIIEKYNFNNDLISIDLTKEKVIWGKKGENFVFRLY